jgi:hypothetical protein
MDKQFILSQEAFNVILNALGELPGKYSFNALKALTSAPQIGGGEAKKGDIKSDTKNTAENKEAK